MAIVNKRTGNIEVKRFYPPFEVHTHCPVCNRPHVFDGEIDYLSYPKVGEPEELTFYCEECDKEWTKNIILRVQAEEV